ncbi:MAG: superoxide dismutase [Fe] [Bacteriovoracaceae bacterium]|nr:superoxide dismutase [Fe] [Bacteriovoracaceae bacterium]
MKFKLPKLPYSGEALGPYISTETLAFHYGKHHQGYINNLNELIKNTSFEQKSLEEIVKTSDHALFNNSAQVWNHEFYWNCLSPYGGGQPKGIISELIDAKWGSYDAFKQAFSKQAKDLFGSGWVWLIQNSSNKLDIVCTQNASNPLVSDQNPLYVIDLWEHAYYIDFKNLRPKYLEATWNIINWDFINNNLNKL